MHIFLLLAGNTYAIAQSGIYAVLHEGKIYLRWKGVQQKGITGYKIYRSDNGGAFEPAGETRIVKNAADINRICKFKAPLFRELTGIKEENGALTPELRDSIMANTAQWNFLGAMGMVNVEIGKALGEWFADSTIEKGHTYLYTISGLFESSERKEIYTSEKISAAVNYLLPKHPLLMASQSGNQVMLEWYRPPQSGMIATYQVYRSGKATGPWEKVNLSGYFNAGNVQVCRIADKRTEKDSHLFYKIHSVDVFGLQGPGSPVVEVRLLQQLSQSPVLEADEFARMLRLRWTPSMRENAVRIYRKTNGKSGELIYQSPPGLAETGEFYDRNPPAGIVVQYWLCEVPGDGVTTICSDTVRIQTGNRIPPRPEKPVATVTNDGTVQLKWQYGSHPVEGFMVERLFKSGAEHFVLTAKPVVGLSITDKLKPDGTEFYYFIYAIGKDGQKSKPSDTVKVVTPDKTAPIVPVFTYAAVEGNIARLKWSGPKDSAGISYTVRIHTGSGWVEKTTISNDLSDSIANSAKKIYSVQAKDAQGNSSPWSQPVTLTGKYIVLPVNRFSAITDTTGYLVFEWQIAAKQATGMYYLEQSADGKTWKPLAEIPGNQVSYRMKYRGEMKKFRFRITVYDTEYRHSKPIETGIEPKP
ncbi:MAG: fibronectin type III domain-containing protein [Bacteroidetes bacterium]|nr:fibronectin type III domain-containing protein [Bacteroidota bacterium]